jgi:hypothetical protein
MVEPTESETHGTTDSVTAEVIRKPSNPKSHDSAVGKNRPHSAKASSPATQTGAIPKPQKEPQLPASTFLGVHKPTETVVIPPNSHAVFSYGALAPEDLATLERMREEYYQAEAHLKSEPDKLVLHDLFLTDFSSIDNSASNRSGLTPLKIPTHIEYIVVRQLETGTKFLKFYVLYTNETHHICEFLADNYKLALEDFMEGRVDAGKIPGDSEQITSKELVFSNRIFIYHETYLSPDQIIAVRDAFKKKGIIVIFRSTDYLENVKLKAKVKQLEKAR